jgi:peptidoglycan/LPS O-acetylase OafA/YrhL
MSPHPPHAGSAATSPVAWLPQLDGIRALAVLSVVTFHTWPQIAPNGGLGVNVFFVLSGFLITRLLVEEHATTGAISLRKFYARRALRLLPALALVLLFCLIVSLTVLPAAFARVTEIATLTSAFYVSDVYAATHGWLQLGLLGHTWSLSAEEQFYAGWPLVLILTLRFGRPGHLILIASICAVAFALAEAALWYLGAKPWTVAPLSAGGIFAGCAVAVADANGWFDRIPHRHIGIAAGVAGLALVAQVVFGSVAVELAGALPLAICAATMVLAASRSVCRPLEFAPLVFIGRISYGIYLWHYPLTGLQGFANGPINFIGVTAVTVLVAWLSYRYVERPALRLRRYFRPIGGGGEASAPVPAPVAPVTV